MVGSVRYAYSSATRYVRMSVHFKIWRCASCELRDGCGIWYSYYRTWHRIQKIKHSRKQTKNWDGAETSFNWKLKKAKILILLDTCSLSCYFFFDDEEAELNYNMWPHTEYIIALLLKYYMQQQISSTAVPTCQQYNIRTQYILSVRMYRTVSGSTVRVQY